MPPTGPLPPGNPPAATPSGLTGKKVIWILVAVVAGCIPILGVVAALAVFGVRKYVDNAKRAEGRTFVTTLASGVIRCAAEPGSGPGGQRGLPESSAPVPPTLAEVQGKKYQSLAREWDDPAFRCAGFRLSDPQYFQYRWERRTSTSGKAVATADFDADGAPDLVVEQSVSCDADGRCSGGVVTESER